MSPARRVRNERALVVAAASLGAVAIAVVLTQTAQVVGRDAVRPVGPTAHPQKVSHRRQVRTTPAPVVNNGPTLPPPPPGAKLPQYRQTLDEYLVVQHPAVEQHQAAAPAAEAPVPAPTLPVATPYAPPQPKVVQRPVHHVAPLPSPVPESDYVTPAAQIVAPSLSTATGPAPTFPPTPSPTPPDRPLGGIEDPHVIGQPAEPAVSSAARSQLSSPVSAVVVVTLTPTGAVTGARIERSTGFSALDNAALGAARATQYAPARVDGRPLGGTYRAVYNFAP